MHKVFRKVKENLTFAFDYRVKMIDNILTVHFDTVEISVAFFDHTKFKIHKIQDVTDEKIENGEVTYDVTGLYKDEGFSAGYRSGTITNDSYKELSFEIYKKILEVKKHLHENKEDEVSQFEDIIENAEPVDSEAQHEIDAWLAADSEEECELLSDVNLN